MDPCKMQHPQTFEDWFKNTNPADRPALEANNYPSTYLVFSSMPQKYDLKNVWLLFWKWPICWQWKMSERNSSMYRRVSKFWRWFQFWVCDFKFKIQRQSGRWERCAFCLWQEQNCALLCTVSVKWRGASVTGNRLPFPNFGNMIPVCTIFRDSSFTYFFYCMECGWWFDELWFLYSGTP